MSHTPAHRQLLRTIQSALASSYAAPLPGGHQESRRDLLRLAVHALAGAVVSRAGTVAPSLDIGIVGAGLSGLSCGYELQKAGVRATLQFVL